MMMKLSAASLYKAIEALRRAERVLINADSIPEEIALARERGRVSAACALALFELEYALKQATIEIYDTAQNASRT